MGTFNPKNELIRYRYTAYGDLSPNSPTPCVYGYNAEDTDYTTSIQYLRARYYDVNLGRFIQKDVYRGSLEKPQSLNRYDFGYNNPIINCDPSGNFVSTLFAGLSGGTRGQRIGGAIGAGLAFAAVTAAIIVTSVVALPVVAAVAISVGVGLAAAVIGDVIAQKIANRVDKTNRPIDKRSVMRSGIYGAVGGGVGAYLAVPIGITSGAVAANIMINTMVVDPIVSGFQMLNGCLANKKKETQNGVNSDIQEPVAKNPID